MRPELRERVAAWLVAQRASGRSVSELATVLGLAQGTVTRWSSGVKPRSMLPVRVVEEEPRRGVRVVSPSGFWIDGVTLVEAAALLRELG